MAVVAQNQFFFKRVSRMPLRYQPKEGSVLICDFRGYEIPEMVKVRPVVVIRKHRTNSLLVTVVPLSTTAPDSLLGHHLELASHLQGASPTCWAKCDMIATVSLSRLDRIKSRDRQGKRIYLISHLATDEFHAIKTAVRRALGL
ncbi:type II toxin-antitoxin system PemK/MazF family toxin [Pseudomonas sp. 9.2(2024)]|uniref:type II toxin-antitoxin system PemK/MazF family toxin n=2 Tax=Pseudomonas TaxID=286 RepID=UPI001F45F871|nr:type II toxin-antitoxin system PemK/MazF family toxin [Pseudomonas paraglycinae]